MRSRFPKQHALVGLVIGTAVVGLLVETLGGGLPPNTGERIASIWRDDSASRARFLEVARSIGQDTKAADLHRLAEERALLRFRQEGPTKLAFSTPPRIFAAEWIAVVEFDVSGRPLWARFGTGDDPEGLAEQVPSVCFVASPQCPRPPR